MNKRTFVPSPENLESRVVLSGGPKFLNGAAVLSPGTLGNAYSQIDKAFSTFAHDGMNYGRLNADLGKAVNLIPYNRRDGLWDEVKAEVSQMQSDISSGVEHPGHQRRSARQGRPRLVRPGRGRQRRRHCYGWRVLRPGERRQSSAAASA